MATPHGMIKTQAIASRCVMTLTGGVEPREVKKRGSLWRLWNLSIRTGPALWSKTPHFGGNLCPAVLLWAGEDDEGLSGMMGAASF